MFLPDTTAFSGSSASFQGYVEFFLLQDLTSAAYSAVRFSAPFNDFAGAPVPATLEAYRVYRDRAAEFIAARNARILSFCASSNHSRSQSGPEAAPTSAPIPAPRALPPTMNIRPHCP